jgi:VWFA-related protein
VTRASGPSKFTAVDIPDPPPAPTAWVRDIAPDVKDNVVADRRLFVILLDDARSPTDPAIVKSTKDTARSLVNQLGPSDLVAVVFTRNNSHAQDFTNDRGRLFAAIDSFVAALDLSRPQGVSGFPPWPPPPADPSELATISGLRQIADMLTDVPHQRKVLMYISVGVGIRTFLGQSLFLLDDLFRFARLSNVNIYGFNPAGLGASTAATDYLRMLAANTGGRATVDTNSFDEGVIQMVRESASYYLIAYQSSNAKADGRFRRIDVRVDRPGVTVRTRSGYNAARDAKVDAAKSQPPAVATAISGLLPRSDVQMQVVAAPFAIPGRSGAALAIVANVHQPTPKVRTIDDITLVTNAYGPEGEPRGTQSQTATVVMQPTPDEPIAQFEVLSRIDLKPGHYNLRLAAHSATLDKTGSVYYAVDVPDFAKDAVSLSGIVLSASGIASAGNEALTSLIPVMPTTRREFIKSDEVTAFMCVYQHAKGTFESVQLDVRIVDDHDAVKFHAAETIAADRFDATRSVDHQFNLPLADLFPGPHLLTVEATNGKNAARRDVRFVMR